LNIFKFNEALSTVWSQIAEADKYVNEKEPWKLEGDALREIIGVLVPKIQQIGYDLQPFMPTTSKKLLEQYSGKITSSAPLFPRI
jgi:methionyl-tRNA synthetase